MLRILAINCLVAKPKQKSKQQIDAEKRFQSDLLVRGEAAEKKKGKLPPGATHEIVKKGAVVQLVRRRFSAV